MTAAGQAHLRWRSLATLVFVLLASIGACSPAPSPTASVHVTSSPDLSNCRTLIEAVDLAKPETIDAADRCRFTREGAQAARAVLETGTSQNALWAAIWVYASSGADPAPLRPLLATDDPSLRVMAGASLLAFGDAAGFAAIEAALDDGGGLAGSEPPLTITEFAVGTLARYVIANDVPAGPASPDELDAVRSGWIAWLGAHGTTLAFDDADGTWSGP